MPPLDRRYSLYSTDSEDNVNGVSKGLDRCAELLTNILEIKHSERVGQKHVNPVRRHQPVAFNNRKSKCDSNSQPTSSKGKSQKLKQKRRTSVYVLTASTESNHQLERSAPAYNERVASSTPVLLTTDQRRRQQDLQQRENILQRQIQLLQKQYDNLQKQNGSSCGESSHVQMQDDPPRAMRDKQKSAKNKGNLNQETKPAQSSLDFTSNAEKPFVESIQRQNAAGVETEVAVCENLDEVDSRAGITKKTTRNVQFLKQPEEQQGDGVSLKASPLDLSTDVGNDSVTTKFPCQGLSSISRDVEKCGKVSSDPKAPSPYKSTNHLNILSYLVGELKAALGDSGDVEVERLTMEIENEIRLLSYAVQSSETPPVFNGDKQRDIDTEVALQPLRSENSALRRKLRIANQRVREMEQQCRLVLENDQNHLPGEGLIGDLHNQLLRERESSRKLMQEKEQAEKALEENNMEKLNLEHLLSEKEEEIQCLCDELRKEKGKVTSVDSNAKLQLESVEITLCAKNKEVALLNIALQQRDSEIERLTELTRGLQQSLTKVLTNVQELHPDDVPISEVSTTSLLDSCNSMIQRDVSQRVKKKWSNRHSPESQIWNDNGLAEDLEKETLTREGTHKYDYKEIPWLQCVGNQHSPVQNEDCDRVAQHEQNGDTPNQDNQVDDASSSMLSTDEFIFKQELANLDTMIARLQDSLREKS